MGDLDGGIGRERAKPILLPPPDWLDLDPTMSNVCLVTDDGSQTTVNLAQALGEQGWQVVVLSFPPTIVLQQLPLPTAVKRVVLADMSEAHLQEQLAAIARYIGPVAAFIHLHPDTISLAIPGNSKAIVKQVFLMAKHLALGSLPGRSCFLTVTRLDGKLGVALDRDFDPISGGLFGLTKTLNWEWEQVHCRAIDLSPELDGATAAQAIVAELHDPNRLIREVGYSSQGRMTLVGEKYRPPNVSKSKGKIDRNRVFLVTGGGRGITAKCAIALGKSYPCKFILLGRSPIAPEPEWARDCTDERELKQRIIADFTARGEKPTPVKVQKVLKGIWQTREIVGTLQAIADAGAIAEYLTVDISDRSALQAKLPVAVGKLGAIGGIIHGAGVLADKLIEQKTSEDFEAVYTAKVAGLLNVLSCINPQELSHLVLFSSAAGFYGNIGQADYAIANEILNKFAYQFKQQHPNCHVVSFNWGPWDGGMVTPELKQLFMQRNIDVIPVEVGTQILVDELAAGNDKVVQVLVGGFLTNPSEALDPELKSYRIRRKLTLEENIFLQDHEIGGHAVLPTVCASGWLANTAEQLYPGFQFFSLSDFKVLKGIVFDETLASEYNVELVEISKDGEQGAIALAAQIWSETESGKRRYHYSGEIKLLRKRPETPIYEGFDSTLMEEVASLSPYEDGTLFHGPSFQGVKRVLNLSREKMTVECLLPQIDERQRGQIPAQAFNAIALDMQFQCMLIWVRHVYDAGSLPSQCRYAEHYQDAPAGKKMYVSLKVELSKETKLVADIVTHDRNGKIYSRVFGAEVSISKQLNRLFVPHKK